MSYVARETKKETFLSRIILVYVPPQHKQYFRPYEVNLTNDVVDRIKEHSVLGANLSAPLLKRVAGDILTPSSVASTAYEFENGESCARFSFFIELVTHSHVGKMREIVSGYTDRAEYTFGRDGQLLLEPETQFIVTSRSLLASAVGGVMRQDNRILNRIERHVAPNATTMRPYDLASSQGADLLLNDYQMMQSPMEEPASKIILSNSTLNTRPQATLAKDMLPSHFVNTVCSAYRDATTEVLENNGDVMGEEHHNLVKGALVPEPISKMEYANAMRLSDPASSNRFTYSGLSYYFPHDDSILYAALPSSDNRSSIVDETNTWNGGDMTTIVGYSIGYMLPVLMSQLQLLNVEFVMDNENSTGALNLSVFRATGYFDGMVDNAMIAAIERLITEELYIGMLYHRVGTFHIHVNGSLVSGTHLRISINGGPAEPYYSPTYAVSNFSPLVALDRRQATDVAYGLSYLTQHLLPIDTSGRDFLGGFANSPALNATAGWEYQSPTRTPAARSVNAPLTPVLGGSPPPLRVPTRNDDAIVIPKRNY